MVKTADLYENYERTLSCSDTYVENLSENSLFPFEGVCIGELETETGGKLPAIIPLAETGGLCFLSHGGNRTEVNETIQAMLLRIVASLPAGMCKLHLYDGADLGANLITLSGLDKKIIGPGIVSNDSKLLNLLVTLQEHIPNVIQKVLGYKYANYSLVEYNKENQENMCPYNFLVITDYPKTLSKSHFTALEHILKNGKRAGVYVIMSFDSTYCVEGTLLEDVPYMSVLNQCTTIYETGGSYHIKNITHESLFRRFKLKLDTSYLRMNVDSLLSFIASKYEEKPTISMAPLFDYLPPVEKWWNANSAKEASIPFGISAMNKIIDLKITQVDKQNTAMVIGGSGSGKSVFLHSVICNAVTKYSPDELNLYLIDFSGVEFNRYVINDLLHARVIAPEAEREFGVCVLRELVAEGTRRMEICRSYNVSNIVELRAKDSSIVMPRLVVIIDEFQKFFEIENDAISREANVKINIIIKEYRKFGINLILATQALPSSSILPRDQIANRVVFGSSPSDFNTLLPGFSKMPELTNGRCIYNSASGAMSANNNALGFFVTSQDVEELMNRMRRLSHERKFTPVANKVIFRGSELPDFASRRTDERHSVPAEHPMEVGLYLGESIAINKADVCAVLRKENGNNLLVIGGEPDVALRIAYYATVSATTAHTDMSAKFRVLNFIRYNDALDAEVNAVFGSIPFDSAVLSKAADIDAELKVIKDEIEARLNDEERPDNHIYIAIYSFQLARMFNKVERRRGDEGIDCAPLLDYILRNGPAVGVFTILQCDNLNSLTKVGLSLQQFSYRVALQMTEEDSNRVMGSYIANKLYAPDKPNSVFRGYFRDNNRNVDVKFKPYK